MSSSTKNGPVDWVAAVLKPLATIMKEVGILGFIVLTLVAFFWNYSSDGQKTEFIDRFFLVKDSDKNPFFAGMIITGLAATVIMQYIYYKKQTDLLKKELDRVGDARSNAQETALKKKLQSSKVNKRTP